MSRRAPGEGSIWKRPDGTWRGAVTLGPGVRRHVSGKTRSQVVAALNDLTALRDKSAGRAARGTRALTVEKWIDRWLEGLEASGRTFRTVQTYRSLMDNHVVPAVGPVRLDRLTVLQVDDLVLAANRRSGPVVAANVRRTLAACLNAAHKKGLVLVAATAGSNPVAVPVPDVKALAVSEHRAIVDVITHDRLAARWLLGLSAGPRQSEVLGMTWTQLTENQQGRASIVIDRQLQRHTYKHGCADASTCPAVKGRACPTRVGGLVLVPYTKGKRTRRVTVLPAVAAALRAWRTAQKAEFLAAGLMWTEEVPMFTGPGTNQPLDPRADWGNWNALLEAAGVGHVGIHGMRHTAATRLLEARVEARVIADLLGWAPATTTVMLARYAHVSEDTQLDALEAAAARLG